MSSIAIEGFSEDQLRLLLGAQVGDLIWLKKPYHPESYDERYETDQTGWGGDDEEGDDEGGDDEGEDDEGEDDEEVDDEEVDDEGAEDEGPVTEVDLSDAEGGADHEEVDRMGDAGMETIDESTDGNAALWHHESVNDSTTANGHYSATVSDISVQPQTMDIDEVDDQSGSANASESHHQSAHEHLSFAKESHSVHIAEVSDQTQVMDLNEASNESGSADGSHGDHRSGDGYGSRVDGEGDNSDSQEPEYSTEETDFERQTEDPVPTTIIYLVHEIVKDASDVIIDVKIIEHRWAPTAGVEHSFQIFGVLIAIHSGSCNHASCAFVKSIKDLNTADGLQACTTYLDPCGDLVRQTVSDHCCPLGCDDGYLHSLSDLVDVIPEYTIPAVSACRPVCPVCIGLELAKEYLALRATLEATHIVDFMAIHEFYFRLNPRREALGYEYLQFDEREWNMLFDDMLSGSEDGDHDGDYNAGQWQQWDEAMDPNAHVKTRPASDATIAALPRILFKDTEAAKALVGSLEEEEFRCGVCMEAMRLLSVAIELPCKHAFEEQCIAVWLKQFASCPTCRAEVPAVGESKENSEKAGVDGDGDVITDGADERYDVAEHEMRGGDEADTTEAETVNGNHAGSLTTYADSEW